MVQGDPVMYGKRTVILADGDFPREDEAFSILKNAQRIVGCDGAAAALCRAGFSPDVIIGDLDSLPAEWKERFSDRLIHVREQETNDLTKAFLYCREQHWTKICILGATGKREDHTLGNLSLLSEYSLVEKDIMIVTNYGTFTVADSPCEIPSVPGQQISIVALDPGVQVTARNLKYPMEKLLLKRWWQATLNEALAESFYLDFQSGKQLLIFRQHVRKGKK